MADFFNQPMTPQPLKQARDLRAGFLQPLGQMLVLETSVI